MSSGLATVETRGATEELKTRAASNTAKETKRVDGAQHLAVTEEINNATQGLVALSIGFLFGH